MVYILFYQGDDKRHGGLSPQVPQTAASLSPNMNDPASKICDSACKASKGQVVKSRAQYCSLSFQIFQLQRVSP